MAVAGGEKPFHVIGDSLECGGKHGATPLSRAKLDSATKAQASLRTPHCFAVSAS
jgi:hypothetical protein